MTKGFPDSARRVVVFGLPTMCLLASCGNTHRSEVFVSILPQQYFAQRIAGSHMAVRVMIGPGANPETYEPGPREMSALSEARLYCSIGVPFEDAWMTRLRAANPDMAVFDTSKGIPRRAGHDPHIWTNPLYARQIAARMRDAFIGVDALHRQDYQHNYRMLADDLAALDRDIHHELAPYAGRAFLAFHAAWGYFADAYGLQQLAIEAEGKEPGPRALSTTIDEARRLGCKIVFVQPQSSRVTADVVARELGAGVVMIDPLAEDYIVNLRSVAAALAQAFALS